METVSDYFGSMVFNDDVMKERLPKDVYKALRRTVDEGKDLDINVANSVANAMKNWALEKGCTHYTHWFQPMTGITAEKHEAFISPAPGGNIGVRRSGFFLSIIGANPPSTFFSCAFSTEPTVSVVASVRNDRREESDASLELPVFVSLSCRKRFS